MESFVVLGSFVQPFDVDDEHSVVVAQVTLVNSADETDEDRQQVVLLLDAAGAIEWGEVLMEAGNYIANKENN